MSGYIGVQPVPQATQRREYFTATSGQATFNTNGYTPNYIDVYMNGVKLSPADFTASNGSDVVLASGATTGDLIQVVSFTPFNVANQTFIGDVNLSSGAYKIGGNIAINSSRGGALTSLALTGNATFGDNDKAIFGAELEIYSDATHARIREYGSGQLKIQGDNMQLLTSDGASTYLEGNASTSAVTLYHASNSPRLSTTSTGVDVSGTLTSDGLNVEIPDNDSGPVTIQQGGNSYFKIVTTNTSESVQIGNSTTNPDVLLGGGNVGIGVVPDNANLPTVVSEYGIYSGNSQANITANTYYNSGWKYEDTNTATRYNQTNGVHYWYTAASGTADTAISWDEAMRIEGGNLLVGTTTTQNLGTVNSGSLIRDGYIQVASTDATATLAYFYGSAGQVGSIGVNGGDNLQISASTADHAGLEFATHIVAPLEAGAASNGTIDLGADSARFKDAYLSGGVDFGGAVNAGGVVSSSNKLDDYEEGTWTPTAANGISGLGVQSATYTKVGRIVTVMAYLTAMSGKNANSLNIGGLPYAPATQNYSTGVVECSTSGQMGICRTNSTNTYLVFYKPASDNTRSNLTGNDVGSAHIIFSITYQTS